MLSKLQDAPFVRPVGETLLRRLREPRRFLQILTGARQVGKTTLILQILKAWGKQGRYVSADEPQLRDRNWIVQQWEAARLMARGSGKKPVVLAIDEIQKIAGWSQTVKRLWDEDTVAGLPLHVVLLGSSPMLLQQGMSDHLGGRFEIIHLPHWSFVEMREAFGWNLEKFILFGGYPGASALIKEPDRWARYVRNSLIETTVTQDVLMLTRVDKPALLRRLFDLGCHYSGQILSYNKMLGQLHDAGNTTTLAHYLDLLAGAGMVAGLPKFTRSGVRRRASSPKLQVFNTGLITALSDLSPEEIHKTPELWGRVVESAVGAHLINAEALGECKLFYWRERSMEVDFVLQRGERITAIEVKSSPAGNRRSGISLFSQRYPDARLLLVGDEGIPLETFLSRPVLEFLVS